MKITVNVPGGDESLIPGYLDQVADAVRALAAITDMDWSRRTRFATQFASEDRLVDGWWKVEP